MTSRTNDPGPSPYEHESSGGAREVDLAALRILKDRLAVAERERDEARAQVAALREALRALQLAIEETPCPLHDIRTGCTDDCPVYGERGFAAQLPEPISILANTAVVAREHDRDVVAEALYRATITVDEGRVLFNCGDASRSEPLATHNARVAARTLREAAEALTASSRPDLAGPGPYARGRFVGRKDVIAELHARAGAREKGDE